MPWGSGNSVSPKNLNRLSLTPEHGPIGVHAASAFSDGLHNDFGFVELMPRGRLVHLFVRSTSHTARGTLGMRKSENFGRTWTAPTNVGSDGTTVAWSIGGGLGYDGRLIATYAMPDSSKVVCTMSDDNGDSWSASQQVLTAGAGRAVAAYGRMIRAGTNYLIQPYYDQPSAGGAGQYISGLLASADNGASWSTIGPIFDSTNSHRLSETAVAYLGGSALLAIARDDAGTPFRQYYSADLGTTWTSQGTVGWGDGNHIAPWTEVVTGDTGEPLVVCHYTNSSTGYGKFIMGSAASLSAGTSGWYANSMQTTLIAHYPTAVYPYSRPYGLLVEAQESGEAIPLTTTLYYSRTTLQPSIPSRPRYFGGDLYIDGSVNVGNGVALTGGGFLIAPDGSAQLPTLSYRSEQSLGLYRSAASTIAQSYGTFTAPSVVASTVSTPALRGVGAADTWYDQRGTGTHDFGVYVGNVSGGQNGVFVGSYTSSDVFFGANGAGTFIKLLANGNGTVTKLVASYQSATALPSAVSGQGYIYANSAGSLFTVDGSGNSRLI